MIKRHTKPTKENKGELFLKKVLYTNQMLKVSILSKKKKK